MKEETRCHDCPYVCVNDTAKKLKNLKRSESNVLLYPKINGELFVRSIKHEFDSSDIGRIIRFEHHGASIYGVLIRFTKVGFVLSDWCVMNMN